MTDPSRRTEEREERRKRLLLLLLLLLLLGLVTTGMGDTVGKLAFRIADPGPAPGPPTPSHPVLPVQPSRPVQIARGRPYAMAGSVSRKLRPGGQASPIEITFESRNRGDGTRVSLLKVSIDSISGGGPGPHPCTAADFAVRQIPAAAYPFYVPFGRSLLSSLIGPGRAPAIRMLDRRDGVLGDGAGNQDACKGATVHLRLTGSP